MTYLNESTYYNLTNELCQQFVTWDKFLVAFCEDLSEDKKCTYPELTYMFSDMYDKDEFIHETFIKYFLMNGLNPQVGLNQLVETVVKTADLNDYFESIFDLIDIFLKENQVTFPTRILLRFNSERDLCNQSYDTIANFIDRYAPQNKLDLEIINGMVDWYKIEPSEEYVVIENEINKQKNESKVDRLRRELRDAELEEQEQNYDMQNNQCVCLGAWKEYDFQILKKYSTYLKQHK
jgi:hypothetical protein